MQIKAQLMNMIVDLQDQLHNAELVDAGQKSSRTKVRKALLKCKDDAHELRKNIAALGKE